MRGTIVPGFEKEHPGAKVELAIGLSKDWVAKLKAAGKDNAPFDVIITNEVWAAPLRAEGYYTTLPAVPNLKDVAPNLKIKDDMGVLALVGPIGLAYRTRQDQDAAQGVEGSLDRPRVQGQDRHLQHHQLRRPDDVTASPPRSGRGATRTSTPRTRRSPS